MRQSLGQTFAMPLLLLCLTVIGLVVGLVANGWADLLSTAALAVPMLVLVRAWWR